MRSKDNKIRSFAMLIAVFGLLASAGLVAMCHVRDRTGIFSGRPRLAGSFRIIGSCSAGHSLFDRGLDWLCDLSRLPEAKPAARPGA